MTWAALIRTALDWRAWALAVVAGLALSLWVATHERDRAQDQAATLRDQVNATAADLERTEAGRMVALDAQAQAEAALAAYAQETAASFKAQAKAAEAMAAENAELKRRVRAANQEITRADPALRIDDPLPRGVRDGLACAGGDRAACASAAAADSGGVQGRAADPAADAGVRSGGPDGA